MVPAKQIANTLRGCVTEICSTDVSMKLVPFKSVD